MLTHHNRTVEDGLTVLREVAPLSVLHNFYCHALMHAREIRNRFTFLDPASGAGCLESFAPRE